MLDKDIEMKHNTFCSWCNLPLKKTEKEIKQRKKNNKLFYCSHECSNFDRAKEKPFIFGVLENDCLAYWKRNFGPDKYRELFCVKVTEKEAEKIFSSLQLLEAMINARQGY